MPGSTMPSTLVRPPYGFPGDPVADPDLLLLPVREQDLPELVPLMQRAFDEDSQRSRGFPGGPPGYDTGEFLRRWALPPHGGTALRIEWEGKLAGACIVFTGNPCEHWLGTLFLDPPFQGRGLGRQVWNLLEKRYPAPLWVAETTNWSARNRHFYGVSCGFHLCGSDGHSLRFEKTFASSPESSSSS